MKPELEGIRAILFDVYGTLAWIPQPTRPYRALLNLAKDQGIEPPGPAATVLMSQRMTLDQAAVWLGITLSEEQKDALDRDLARELESIRLFQEVPVVLMSLRDRGFRIGLCSNLALPYVAPAWRLLESLIDVPIWSCEVGLVKPDPAIYQLAASRLAVSEGEILMIGDTYAADVAGPQAAGLNAHLLDRRGSRSVESWATLEVLL